MSRRTMPASRAARPAASHSDSGTACSAGGETARSRSRLDGGAESGVSAPGMDDSRTSSRSSWLSRTGCASGPAAVPVATELMTSPPTATQRGDEPTFALGRNRVGRSTGVTPEGRSPEGTWGTHVTVATRSAPATRKGCILRAFPAVSGVRSGLSGHGDPLLTRTVRPTGQKWAGDLAQVPDVLHHKCKGLTRRPAGGGVTVAQIT